MTKESKNLEDKSTETKQCEVQREKNTRKNNQSDISKMLEVSGPHRPTETSNNYRNPSDIYSKLVNVQSRNTLH